MSRSRRARSSPSAPPGTPRRTSAAASRSPSAATRSSSTCAGRTTLPRTSSRPAISPRSRRSMPAWTHGSAVSAGVEGSRGSTRSGWRSPPGDWHRAEALLTRYEQHVEQHPDHVLAFMAGVAARVVRRGARRHRSRGGLLGPRSRAGAGGQGPQARRPGALGAARFWSTRAGASRSGEDLIDEVLAYRDEEGRASVLHLADRPRLAAVRPRPREEFPRRATQAPGPERARRSRTATLRRPRTVSVLRASGRTRRMPASARERLAGEGRRAEAALQRDRALAFYREVGATAYVRRGEALLAQTA